MRSDREEVKEHRSTRRGVAAAVALVLCLVVVACGGDDGAGHGGRVITFVWGAEPQSLDPGLATDTTSANVLLNVMDPLVTLEGDDLVAKPHLAESWDVSEDGSVYTFRLRDDGRWTNGDPVTADDFEFSWKRTLSPELASDYAYQLYGIEGAEEYNRCAENCDRLRRRVGIEAVDDRTLKVTLTSPQPWFEQLVAHHSFLAVHPETVRRHGREWTEPENIVTNGPFRLARWQHEARLDLAKWPDWRGAEDVALDRVDGRIITEGTTAVRAFEAGEADALDAGLIPPADIHRLERTPEYYRSPALGTYFYGFNVENVADVRQRRAMSLAIDRETIVDRITRGGNVPANGMTPKGIAAFDLINVDSPWTPAAGDLERARALMRQAARPKERVTLYFNNSPGHKEIAVAIQAMWRELGIQTTIKQQEWAQFLEFLGPPPHRAVDVFRLGWIYDYPDAMNGLELWTCNSGNNSTGWCNRRFDALVERARKTPADTERYALYRRLEEIMFGPDGELPIIPIFWYTNTSLVAERIRDTFEIDPQTFIDFAAIRVEE